MRRRRKTAAPSEGGFKLNVARVPLSKARAYAERIFSRKGVEGIGKSVSVDEAIPDFDRNYKKLQAKMGRALDIPRIQMPVIEPEDMGAFQKRLSEGAIDIFPPFARGQFVGVPANWDAAFTPEEGEEWVQLGYEDGDLNDDKIMALWGKTPAKALLPLQGEIWLEKLIGNISRFGVPSTSSRLTKETVITSAEGYILDGHHRFGQLMLANPNLAIASLNIGLDIDELLEVGRAYGAAIGRSPKAASLRSRTIRLASQSPKGSELRRELLKILSK